MGTPPVVVPPKVSWLKRFGQVVGKILKVIAKDSKAVADAATPVAEALLPQFAPEIQMADNLVSNIAKQAIVTETISAAASAATSGPAKLTAVIAGMGSEIDAWVQSNFPGAKAISTAGKAGLVNSVVAILNEVDPPATVPGLAAAPVAILPAVKA